MKNNKLDWFIKGEKWCKGYLALTEDGIPVSPQSPEANLYDLHSAILVSYGWDEIDDVIRKFKLVYQTQEPEKWKACIPMVTQVYRTDEDGNVEFDDQNMLPKYDLKLGEPPLHELNDELENFAQLKRLLTMI